MARNGLRVIAYHEAGHAVAAWSLRVPLKEIVISKSCGKCMHTLILGPGFDPELMGKDDWAKAEKKAIVLFAGEVAEYLGGMLAEHDDDDDLAEEFNYAYNVSHESTEPGSDREEIKGLVQLIFGDGETEANEWIERSREKSMDILIKNWGKVCELSDVLLEKNILTGAEAISIIETVTGFSKP